MEELQISLTPARVDQRNFGLWLRTPQVGQVLNGVVADTCEQHWQPLGPSDDVPTEPVSATVALADKLDTLCGFWAIDEKPTGSKDPFALRRAALGIIRLVFLLKSLKNRSKVLKKINFFRVGVVMLKNIGHIGCIYTFS